MLSHIQEFKYQCQSLELVDKAENINGKIKGYDKKREKCATDNSVRILNKKERFKENGKQTEEKVVQRSKAKSKKR